MLFDFLTSKYNSQKELKLKHLKNHITQHYNVHDLQKYLREGWLALVKAYQTLKVLNRSTTQYTHATAKIIDALMCTECYPARKELLLSGEKAMLESPKTPKEEKVNSDKILNQMFLADIATDYYFERCGKAISEEITKEDQNKYFPRCYALEKEDKLHRKSMCKNYLAGLIQHYKTNVMDKMNLDPINIEKLRHSDYTLVKEAFISTFTASDEYPCGVRE